MKIQMIKTWFYFTLFFSITSSFNVIENKVFICNSEGAYAYHLNKNCAGLKRCNHKIIEVTKDEAIKKYKRRLCGHED